MVCVISLYHRSGRVCACVCVSMYDYTGGKIFSREVYEYFTQRNIHVQNITTYNK